MPRPIPETPLPQSLLRRGALTLLSGVLLTLLYPPFDAAVLGWVALTPLFLALDGAPPLTAFGLGWLAGTVGSLGVTGHWMFHAAYDYFGVGMPGAIAFTVGVNQIFVSLHFALFGLGAVFLPRRRRALWLALWFVTTEHVRAHSFGGNPWALLGQSPTALPLLQLVDLTGVYGLTFLLSFSSAALADLPRTRRPALMALVLVSGVLAYGEVRLWQFSRPAPDSLAVEIVQANLANGERGRPENFAAHLRQYIDLTRHGATPPANLIVWPENAVGFFPQDNPDLLAPVMEQLRSSGATLVFGAPRAADSGAGSGLLHNSAFVLDSAGALTFYDKRRLLPFVEYMPLRADGPYSAGGQPAILNAGGHPFGALICYEALYPELARDLTTRGATFLVNLSNDSWFEAGAGPQQHYAFARLRAIENRVSLVRATNSGISGVIDPSGQELLRLPARAAVAEQVMMPIDPAWSFYRSFGDVFALGCSAMSVVGLLSRRR